MGEIFAILLPVMLLMSRIGALLMVLPIFGWRTIPIPVKIAMTLAVTGCFAVVVPMPPITADLHWVSGVLLMVKEILLGVALGLAVTLVYRGVQQGAAIAARQMGFADAGIGDPAFDESAYPVELLLEMVFIVFFLANDGHHLLLMVIARSYDAFPVGQMPHVGLLAEAVLQAGSTMLLFALQLSGPLLAAFLVLGVLLGVIARVLPELNIMMLSLPLRVALGIFLASLLVPYLGGFAFRLAEWMHHLLPV